jgi:hypothetical protein
MTTPTPKQRTETAVEDALRRAFPQATFKAEVNDALDKLDVHWRGSPSHTTLSMPLSHEPVAGSASNTRPPKHYSALTPMSELEHSIGVARLVAAHPNMETKQMTTTTIIDDDLVSNFDERLDELRTALRRVRQAVYCFDLTPKAGYEAELILDELENGRRALHDNVKLAIGYLP